MEQIAGAGGPATAGRSRGASLAIGRMGGGTHPHAHGSADSAMPPSPRCEGMLQKWTNYVSGWQPRFVVLGDGTLSYFLSRSEALQSSRGSINVANATVKVHPTDGCRFDIETAYISLYFRAQSTSDRQRWLVALGSTKALSDHGKMDGVQTDAAAPRQRGASSNGSASAASRAASLPDVSLDDVRAELATCRLILETQAMSLDRRLGRLAAELSPLRLSPEGAELLQKLSPGDSVADEALVLSATCNTFLQALGDCVRLLELQERHVSEVCAASAGGAPMIQRRGSAPVFRENSLPLAAVPPSSERAESSAAMSTAGHTGGNPASGGSEGSGGRGDGDGDRLSFSGSDYDTHVTAAPQGPPTFFSGMEFKFTELRITQEGIPTVPFLKCAAAMLPILDKLGSTAFAPVKADINGNIRKLQGRYDFDPVANATLELMVRHEIMTSTTSARNSATDALLWLKRALEFVNQFLIHVLSGADSLTTAASKAYELTLSQYHGWIVRGVFSLAVRAVPTKDSFFAALGPTEDAVIADMASFAGGLSGIISSLASFYNDNNLDSNAKV